MPYRRTTFATGQVYHVLNRSIASIPIFKTLKDHQRIIESIDYYRFLSPGYSFSHFKLLSKEEQKKHYQKIQSQKQLIEIYSYCIMPNHFHFLVKQKESGGISKFMRKIQNSYAKYFNVKNKRSGALFQSMFKAVLIETDEQLMHVSRYIHLNPSSSHLIEIDDLKKYKWSSFPDYFGKTIHQFLIPKPILMLFSSKRNYEKFVFDQAEYQQRLQEIKHLTLEK